MTVRIGVIGTGAIGRDHARRINQVLTGARITALSDVNPEGAKAVKADVAPDAEIFATGEELIASDKVDAVLVTSWGATHEQYVLAAIAAGQALLLREAARHHRRGREAHRRRRGRRTASASCRSASCAATTRATAC